MPPHPHGGHHGGGRSYPVPYPVFEGGAVVLAPQVERCVVRDQLGRTRLVACDLLTLGDDEVDVVDEVVPKAPTPIIRSAMNLGQGIRRRGGSTPYYHFAAMAKSYPFDWHAGPGGVPTGTRAAESAELSGSDLYESGLNPYSMAYPPVASRGFKFRSPAEASPLSGMWGDLSDNERKLAMVGAAGLGVFLFLKLRKRRRKNPARPRRGRKRAGVRARRRRRWR